MLRNRSEVYLISLCFTFLYWSIVFGCERFDRFNMPSLFKQGDIIIGGIFPVFLKEIITMSTYEWEPPEVKCEG